MRIDAQGFRRDFGLDILEVGKRGLERVGRWEMSTGANYTRLWRDREAEYRQELKDKNMIVTVPAVSRTIEYRGTYTEVWINETIHGL